MNLIQMAERPGWAVSSSARWQIALTVGIPVAVGVGYWYYTRDNKNKHAVDEKKESSDSSNQVSQKIKPKTPLEEATVLKEKGNDCFKNGKYDEALEYYQKAIDLCPKSEVVSLATFYQNQAAAYERMKNYEEIINSCNKALELNPKYTKALLRRAKAYEQKNEFSLAFEDVTTVCLLENFQTQSTLSLADRILNKLVQKDVKEAMANKVPVMPSNYFITTYFSTFINDPVNAFFKQTEGDFTKGFLKAVDCMKKKDYDSVIAACTEEINMTDSESQYKIEALVLRGTFHQLTGDYAAATSDLNAVITNEKADVKLKVNALIKRACIHMQLEDRTKCFEDFQKAIEIDPNNPDIYHHKGQISVLTGKLEESTQDFAMALKLNPGYSITAVQKCYTDYRCAMVLQDENKLNAALQRFEQLINDYPNCAECYSLYAQVLSSRDEYEKADELYQKGLKLEPKNATLLVFRAISKLKASAEVDAAVKLIEEALELDDKCLFGYETLGTIEVQRSNMNRAIELFDKAINIAKSELEMTHLYTLKNAATAQKTALEKLMAQMPGQLIS